MATNRFYTTPLEAQSLTHLVSLGFSPRNGEVKEVNGGLQTFINKEDKEFWTVCPACLKENKEALIGEEVETVTFNEIQSWRA